MRLPSAILLALLPAYISAAGDQVPIQEKASSLANKVKDYAASVIPEIPNPIDAGAAAVAAYKVEKINIRNYERKLGPKRHGEEEWMIYLTGGNKTCHGRCGVPDRVWNESVPILAALPAYNGIPLKLATLNCDPEEILCTAWAAAVPSIIHFIFPQQVGDSQPLSPFRDIHLNISAVEHHHITDIPRASKSRFLEYEEYRGAFHPVDGTLRKLGLLNTVGWILWGMGTTPTWLMMLTVSFFTRQYMSKKHLKRAGLDGAPPAAGAQPAAPAGGQAKAPAVAGSSPKNNPRNGGGKKKR